MKVLPPVTIVLPTFNRLRFLPEALRAISGQTFTDWELIIVDDGSTDGTQASIPMLTASIGQPIHYVYQENQGAYGARNTGLNTANGRYIAFYDSDDIWLPHHLQDCVQALDAHIDLDFVYGACRIVDHDTGDILANSTFYVEDVPRPFLCLNTRKSGGLRILEDPGTLPCMICHGLYNGLQNSVIRRHVFDDYRFESAHRNEAEDQLFVIQCLLRGFKIGYFNSVHVDYRVHKSNSSAVGGSADLEKQKRVLRLVAEGYERMLGSSNWPYDVRTAFVKRLGDEYFWNLGYAAYWMSGDHVAAMPFFWKGLQYWPWDWRRWKTYLKCWTATKLKRRDKRQ